MAIWLWHWTSKHDQQEYYSFYQMVNLFADDGVSVYWDKNGLASTILLSILTVCFIISFSILLYNIKKYYKGKMSIEMQWLSILFAVFGISYGLRTGYQYEVGNFKNYIHSMVIRWHFVNCAPVIFDILSIGAILLMHHMNFRPRQNADTLFGEEIYDIEPEEVESLEHMLPGDEFEQHYQRRGSSTLNSDGNGSKISPKAYDQAGSDSEDRWLTTKMTKNTFERFDLDSNLKSEIERNVTRLKREKLKHTFRQKRSR